MLTVYAKDPMTHRGQSYEIKVKRLRGSETEVRNLRIDGATLNPAFDPKVRKYTAALALGSELATLLYVVRDNGQQLSCEASAQQAASSDGSDESGGIQRRLDGLLGGPTNACSIGGTCGTGEVQYREHHQSFLIDVGMTRRLTLTVQSSDPEQRKRGSYVVVVTRQGCTIPKPL